MEPFYDGLRRACFYGDRIIITRSYNSTATLRPVNNRDKLYGDRAATVEILQPYDVFLYDYIPIYCSGYEYIHSIYKYLN